MLALVAKKKPDIVVVDVQMPVIDGIEATRYLKANYFGVGIIVMSAFENERLISDAIQSGINSFINKDVVYKEILAAIIEVQKGNNYFSGKSKIIYEESDEYQANLDFEKPELSLRELQIIRLLCEELSNEEIAFRLDLKKRTVEDLRLGIQNKMGVRNLAGLVIYAIKNKIFKIRK